MLSSNTTNYHLGFLLHKIYKFTAYAKNYQKDTNLRFLADLNLHTIKCFVFACIAFYLMKILITNNFSFLLIMRYNQGYE